MSTPKRLYRDTNDQKIAGVCSGLARHLGVDPLLVRIGFVAALLIGGAPIVAYLLMWWLVDPAPAGHWQGVSGDPTGDARPDSWAAPTVDVTNDVTDHDTHDGEQPQHDAA